MNFHRYYFPGQIVFITQVVKDRKPVFNNQKFFNLLNHIVVNVKTLYPFVMLAYVVLPDHFHMLIQPTDQGNFSQIMHSLKSNFTREYKQKIKHTGSLIFWQKRFWDHIIRSEMDLENHIHYIHYNPIKHGYAENLSSWKYSSYFAWQSRGLYDDLKEWTEPELTSWGE